MSQPPKEMYEALFELNLKGLLEAVNKRDFDRMHRAFNRMTHALEQIEIYQRESAPVYCGDHIVSIDECGCKL